MRNRNSKREERNHSKKDGQMKAQDNLKKLAGLAVMGSLLLSLGTLAVAQSDAQSDSLRGIYASAASVPTNLPGIHTFADPPKGFNPVAASDEELATYGFPPRPDKQAHPDQYASWEREMKLAKIRWNGELKPLSRSEHGMMPPGSSPSPEAFGPETSGPKQIQTNNASGVIVSSGQKKFTKNSIAFVSADITVPTVEPPFGANSCPTGGYMAVSSVGIDGFVFNTGNGYGYDPQLEAGLFQQISCSGDIYYFGVTGWQGNYSVTFNVNPGDVVYADTYTYGGSESYAYVEDNTTMTYGTFSVTTSGIIGATGIWAVERSCCNNNQPIALPNTTNIAFGGAFATNEDADKFFYPGSQVSTTQVLNMTDDAGTETIEQITQGSTGFLGSTALWFETKGCAAIGGCTP
jgi:hypothetical protein